jgi:hypothetical protein
MPEAVKDALANAAATTLIEEGKNQAAEDLLQRILDTISHYTDEQGQAELETAKAFVEILKMVETQGTKIISLGSNNTPVETPITVEDV